MENVMGFEAVMPEVMPLMRETLPELLSQHDRSVKQAKNS